METDRLRWFLAVAKAGGIRPAATKLHVSPGAVSKAITDLEVVLGQRLFVRTKRRFVLTEAGSYLAERALDLLQAEDDIRENLGTASSPRRLALYGTEALVSLHFADVVRVVGKRFPQVLVEPKIVRTDDESREAIAIDLASVALVTESPRAEAKRALPSAKLATFAGLSHPLTDRASRGIAVEEVIAHAFVLPDSETFGPMEAGASVDGWRDDVFPRPRRMLASTLAVVGVAVEAGTALAYLPIPLGERLRATVLQITGCPYSCTCEGYLVRSARASGWVRQLF